MSKQRFKQRLQESTINKQNISSLFSLCCAVDPSETIQPQFYLVFFPFNGKLKEICDCGLNLGWNITIQTLRPCVYAYYTSQLIPNSEVCWSESVTVMSLKYYKQQAGKSAAAKS